MKAALKKNIVNILREELKAAKIKVTPELIEMIITKILDYVLANVGKKARKVKELEARIRELEAQIANNKDPEVEVVGPVAA